MIFDSDDLDALEKSQRENEELKRKVKQLARICPVNTHLFDDASRSAALKKSINTVKTDAIRELLELLFGAYVNGFTDTNTVSLATLYQCARNHVKDNYKQELPDIVEWIGKEGAIDCGLDASKLEESQAIEEPICEGCGSKGFQGKCNQCIPY